jgi:hypothetical protein
MSFDMNDNVIVNRVASSSLITFDIEQLYQPGERALIDIKDQLFQELILREKDFREYVKSHDWSQYQNKYVAITCTTDAIVPVWAYMLIATALSPFAKKIVFGSLEQLEERLLLDQLSTINWESYQSSKVVIKGCSKIYVPASLYVEVVNRLMPHVSSIMFGEPCSTVPLYKRPKQ